MQMKVQIDPKWFAKQKAKIQALKTQPLRAIHQTGTYIANLAKEYAPKSTGKLMEGVVSRNTKSGVTIYAYDPLHRVDGNALAAWADRKFPFQYGPGRQKVLARNQTVVYGGAGVLKSGRSPVWTGRVKGDAGYFTLAVREGRLVLREKMANAVHASIAGIKI